MLNFVLLGPDGHADRYTELGRVQFRLVTALLRFQNIILGMIARGEGAEAATDRLCLEIEAMLPGVVVSVLRLERNGLLHTVSSPSLPAAYSGLIANLMIGPNVGSCGTAAYLRTPIAVTDIESDPRWAAFRAALRPTGLQACWSSPIIGTDGTVLGTLALYFPEARAPSEREMRIALEGNELCIIALEQRGPSWSASAGPPPTRSPNCPIARASTPRCRICPARSRSAGGCC